MSHAKPVVLFAPREPYPSRFPGQFSCFFLGGRQFEVSTQVTVLENRKLRIVARCTYEQRLLVEQVKTWEKGLAAVLVPRQVQRLHSWVEKEFFRRFESRFGALPSGRTSPSPVVQNSPEAS